MFSNRLIFLSETSYKYITIYGKSILDKLLQVKLKNKNKKIKIFFLISIKNNFRDTKQYLIKMCC